MDHSFNVELACSYGIEQAVFIQNLYYWIKKNAANKVNFFDGRCWTYNSAKAYTELFPYMNESKIYRVIKSLVDNGFLLKGNYNKNRYVQTSWYSFSDNAISILQKCGYDITNIVESNYQKEENHFAKMKNGNCGSEKCITDINTNINSNINTDINTNIVLCENEISQNQSSNKRISRSLGLNKENLNVKQSTIDKIDKAFEQLVFPFEDDEVKRLYFVLCCSPKWRNKTLNALQMSLNKVQMYDKEFVKKLIEDSIAGGWQGLVFENTDAKYQDYIRRNRLSGGPVLRQMSESEKADAMEYLKMVEEDDIY